MSNIIFSFVLEGGAEKLIGYINELVKQRTKYKKIEINGLASIVDFINNSTGLFDSIEGIKIDTDEDNKKIVDFYCGKIDEIKATFKKELSAYKILEITQSKTEEKKTTVYNLYTYLMQHFGNNLRKSADYTNDNAQWEEYALLKRVSLLIEKLNLRYNRSELRICIDALRNPFEINFFKDNYKNFYTFSINVSEGERRENLLSLSYSEEEVKNLDKVEYPSKINSEDEILFHQNIQGCIENADVHLNNNIKDDSSRNHTSIKEQVVRYIALILHPGLVSPSRIESCMQLAYNTKLNSGCLSRQVGAVITDSDYSIKAVGWNDVPHGQTSCHLRTLNACLKEKNKEQFSEYELSDVNFENALTVLNDKYKKCDAHGLNCHYCFKDIYNALEKNKNQVHTRSLHAEENAFLQLSKYAGTGINGGKLFVTASPCELCSKKSYQLGITDIYYVDPYPGIAQSNILESGINRPQIHLYYGAIGAAYSRLYTPKISFKDELKYITQISPIKVISEMNTLSIKSLSFDEVEFEKVSLEMVFETRTKLTLKHNITLKPKNNIKEIERILVWTGGSEVEFKPNGGNPCKIVKLEKIDAKIKYRIDFEPELQANQIANCSFDIVTDDNSLSMKPYVAHRIRYRTKALELILTIPKDCDFIKRDTIAKKTFADFDKDILIESINYKEEDKYIFSVKNPSVNYCYSIEWEFANSK